MELNEQDKERIIAEEKLRMDIRREFFKENFGRMGWHSYGHGGFCGYGRPWGFGLFKALVLGLALFALFQWGRHSHCEGYPGYYGQGSHLPETVPAPQAAPKN